MALKCPRDCGELTVTKELGIEIDSCGVCGGAWYEDEELAELEATVTDDPDHRRGMIDYAKRESELSCPECGAKMRAFNYRAYDLELDACEEAHGFWLDVDEAARVRDVMKERVAGLSRSASAQEAWNRAKQGGRGGGIVDNLKGMFGRRR